MNGNSIIKHKAKEFAKRIIKLYYHLCETKREYILSKQLLRSGTSIGANVNEALCGFSKKDFLAKMYIAFKECSETQYWLELLVETNIIGTAEFESINSDCRELLKMLSSITKTTAESLGKSTPNS